MDNKKSLTLPYVTLQPSIGQVIRDVAEATVPAEDAWVSCYRQGAESVHGKVKIQRQEGGGAQLDWEGGVDGKQVSSDEFLISCPSLDIPPTPVHLPKQTIQTGLKRGINCFDVSSTLPIFAVGGDDGQLEVQGWREDGNPVECCGHVGDLHSVQFFPSGSVILSSSHLHLLIHSALDGTCPRSFKGHKAAIACTSIIDRGRNVLSGSRDGTVRLWDVPSGASIRTVGVNAYSAVLALAEGARPESVQVAGEEDRDPREVGTEGRAVYAALSSGKVSVIDLRTKTEAATLAPSPDKLDPLHAIAVSPTSSPVLAAGARSGLVHLYDTRNASSPLVSWQRNDAPITSLLFPNGGAHELLVAAEDGLPYRARILDGGADVEWEKNVQVAEEFVGLDCDAATSIRYGGFGGGKEGEAGKAWVWVSGRDGAVRRY